MKSMCTAQEQKKLLFNLQNICHRYIKVMLTASYSSNESKLQFITENLNRCLKQEQRDCHVEARAVQPPQKTQRCQTSAEPKSESTI